ncbi:hypothetical protein Btru_014824 [Bulinus truncatus]|nr:hypothetical protein Btru_014824 [Bulinus truncatus]
MTKADNQATKSKTVKKVGVATFGKTFVLALPGMNGSGISVSFQLFTLHYEDVKVSAVKRWHADDRSVHCYKLTRNNPAVIDNVNPHPITAEVDTRWTYLLTASHPIQVTVNVGSDVTYSVLGSMLAIPLEGWGNEYIAVTSNYMPSIQVVNGNKEQTVQVIIASSISSGFTVVFKGMTYTNVAKLPVTLNSYEGLSLEQCSDPTSSHGSLTGTLIKSEMPVGVICGNCLNELQSAHSNCLTDASLEMPLSISNYGKIFLTFKLSLGYARGCNVISASQNATEVKVFKSRGYKVTTVLESQHYIAYSPGSVNIGEMKEPRVIVADKPIQVVLFLNSSCYVTSEFRIIAMTVLTPFGLFMDNYYWTSRLEHGYERVVVISSAAKLLNVSFDHSRIDTLPHFYKHTISQNSIAEFDSVPGPHVLYSTVSHRYGAYVYGYMREAASRVFIYPAGFVSMAGRPVSCDSDNISHIDGDLVDNDCDMRVDEEENSRIDNDYDGLAHEDEGSYHLVHGSWSFWTTWQCESKSSNKATRVRYCNNPPPRNGGLYCKGSENETQNANCSALNRDVVDGGWLVIKRTCQTCTNGSGMAHIHRMCIDPPPSEGGKQCDGDYIIYGPDDYCTVVLLCKPREVPGVWSEWESWECLENCSVKHIVRLRRCMDPPFFKRHYECPGYSYELGEPICNQICSTSKLSTSVIPKLDMKRILLNILDGQPGSWGFNCSKECNNCDSPCDKETGTCTACKPGYRFPRFACSQECKPFTYGFECMGDCSVECGGYECLERIHGTCPTSSLKSLTHSKRSDQESFCMMNPLVLGQEFYGTPPIFFRILLTHPTTDSLHSQETTALSPSHSAPGGAHMT